jgi:predicted NAD/FAD-binding protein
MRNAICAKMTRKIAGNGMAGFCAVLISCSAAICGFFADKSVGGWSNPVKPSQTKSD